MNSEDRQNRIVFLILGLTLFLEIFFPLYHSPLHITTIGKYRVSYYADSVCAFEPDLKKIIERKDIFVLRVTWSDTVQGRYIFCVWRWYDKKR